MSDANEEMAAVAAALGAQAGAAIAKRIDRALDLAERWVANQEKISANVAGLTGAYSSALKKAME